MTFKCVKYKGNMTLGIEICIRGFDSLHPLHPSKIKKAIHANDAGQHIPIQPATSTRLLKPARPLRTTEKELRTARDLSRLPLNLRLPFARQPIDFGLLLIGQVILNARFQFAPIISTLPSK